MLKIKNLKITIPLHSENLYPVNGLSLTIPAGKTYAIVGESGCGKSMSALAIMQLLPNGVVIEPQSEILLADKDLLTFSEVSMREVRGKKIAMIFQEPMTSLNPILSVGEQIKEALPEHIKGSNRRDKVYELLNAVKISEPTIRFNTYPHELSGGMKQRVMIAMALAGEPDLLIADEPTTALDVTTQAEILSLLKEIQQKNNMAMLFISHDLGVVKEMADWVGVMYAGHIVEEAHAITFFQKPLHPYSQKLFASVPSIKMRDHNLLSIKGQVPSLNHEFTLCRFVDRCDYAYDVCRKTLPSNVHYAEEQQVRCHLYDVRYKPVNDHKVVDELMISHQQKNDDARNLLTVSDLKVYFPVKQGLLRRTTRYFKAVDGVSFSLAAGKTLAIVGESGSGKTTVALSLLHLVKKTSGEVLFKGQDLSRLSGRGLRKIRQSIQIVFQDPYSSMDPRMLVKDILTEGIMAQGLIKSSKKLQVKTDELLNLVGLPLDSGLRYPHEFSGGQRQRIAIARALSLEPEIIICDEATSALDVSVQAQILNLLKDLQLRLGLSYLFITHNMSVVSYLADEVAVMSAGKIVEQGSALDILIRPSHPYTKSLLASVPMLS